MNQEQQVLQKHHIHTTHQPLKLPYNMEQYHMFRKYFLEYFLVLIQLLVFHGHFLYIQL